MEFISVSISISSIAIPRLHTNPLHLPLSRSSISNPRFSPLSPSPIISLSATPAAPPTPKPLSSLPRTILISAATIAAASAAALLFHRPSLAAAIPSLSPTSSLSETLPNGSNSSDEIKSLRSEMELKISTNEIPDAIAIVDRLISLEPDNPDLSLLKADLHSYAGDSDTAKEAFEEMLDKNPLLVEAYHGLVMVASRSENHAELDGILKRVEGAMVMCKKEKKKEDLRDFKLLLGQIKVVQGKYEEALKIYEGLVKEEPRDFRPYLCEGIIYSMLMKNDEAEKRFEKYRRLVPRGHPYSRFFDDGMMAMKVFSQIEENKRKASAKVRVKV